MTFIDDWDRMNAAWRELRQSVIDVYEPMLRRLFARLNRIFNERLDKA